jgi:hypothetical protein
MRRLLLLAASLSALTPPLAAHAQDMSALARDAIGLPISLKDATAGPWTLQTRAGPICTVSFRADRLANGANAADIPSACAAALPPGVVGWKPVTDGLALVGADGKILLDFNQWTPRDLVARRAGAPYLELVRPKG